LEIGRTKVGKAETWLAQVPFSIYLGWITVATVANATAVLDFYSWTGFGIAEETWLVVMLVVALIVAGLVTWSRRDIPYLLVLAWAFAGIAVKHGEVPVVNIAAWAATGAAVVMVLAAAAMQRSRR
jgi:hypothetical protein